MPERLESDKVTIFDTTLRDGEQSSGISLNKQEKLEIAHQLARLGVDVIEAGFPIASPGEAASVAAISQEVEGPVICALARTSQLDIETAWHAIKDATRPRIHTFIATSDIHIEKKLQSTRENVKGQVRAAVAHARSLTDDVEFSAEDASRSDIEYLAEVIQIALAEGATTINLPDTVGYAVPQEYAAMFTELYSLVPGMHDVTVSVHCHNDLGLAVANSLSGLETGARQIECAINGIGERAGNASLEELVMLFHTRESVLDFWTDVETTEIARSSRLVSRLTGYQLQPNKAIVGANSFRHEAGIHQAGILQDKRTYEIMRPEDIGLATEELVLGKHSGRHALEDALEKLGYHLDGQQLREVFNRFKDLADRKKVITAMDLESLLDDKARNVGSILSLESFEVTSSTSKPTKESTPAGSASSTEQQETSLLSDDSLLSFAKAKVRLFRSSDREVCEGLGEGDGPVDAVFAAINQALGVEASLQSFHISAVTEGQDALGEAAIVVEVGGEAGAGQAVSTDIVEAAARAYLRALEVATGKSSAAGE